MGWEINSAELRNKLIEHGVPAGASQTNLEQIAILLTHRIGQENAMKQRWQRSRGDHYVVHKADLHRAVKKAIENPRHYLHLADRRLTAATLIALQELIGSGINHSPSDVQATLRVIGESDHAWMLFLRGFFTGHLDPVDRMIARAWGVSSTWSLMKGLGAEAVRGGAQFLISVGDSADMRLHVAVNRALKSFDSLDVPSQEVQLKVAEARRESGLPVPPPSEEAADIRDRLAGYMEKCTSDAELIALVNDHISLRSDLDKLLTFIAAYGRRRLGNEASEVLLTTRTDLYPKRAAVPVGRPSPNIPKIDPFNQEQVFGFLETLGVRITENTKEAVWAYWRGAWDQDVLHAYDIAWDLDHTLFEYRANFLKGEEEVQMHPVLIRLVALALRDEAPIIIITNTVRSRIADIANHPAFGAFRFAAFLRMPEDPYITVEEVASMRSITSYEELVEGKTLNLETFEKEGLTFSERLVEGVVARALLAAFRDMANFQGTKNRRLIEKQLKKIVPLIIIDDQVEHAQIFIDSGGKVAIVVPRVKKDEPLYDPERAVIDIFTIAQELHRMTAIGKRVTELDRRIDASRFKEGDFPKIAARVEHPDFARKMIDGWLIPIRRMWAQKRKVIKRLEQEGKYGEALKLALSLAGFRNIRVMSLQEVRAEVEEASSRTPPHGTPAVDSDTPREAAPAHSGKGPLPKGDPFGVRGQRFSGEHHAPPHSSSLDLASGGSDRPSSPAAFPPGMTMADVDAILAEPWRQLPPIHLALPPSHRVTGRESRVTGHRPPTFAKASADRRVTSHESLVGAPLGAPNSLSLRAERSNPDVATGSPSATTALADRRPSTLLGARDDRQGVNGLDFAHAQRLAKIEDAALRELVKQAFLRGETVEDFQREGIEVLGRRPTIQKLYARVPEEHRKEFLILVGMQMATTSSIDVGALEKQLAQAEIPLMPVGVYGTTGAPVHARPPALVGK